MNHLLSSRRLLILVIACLAITVAIPAFGQDMTYSEAPMLAEMVANGELPPVEERLPANPLVVEPIESVGEYGGTWRRAWRGINDFHTYGRTVYEPMLRWPRDPQDPVQPGLAERWEWSEDGTELTLFLREGLKWSDGAPFTVDDILFWWEYIENDENITPAIHSEWVVNGEPMELEKIDDITITLKFAGPNGLAETVGLAFHGNQWPLGFERFGFFAPAHYLTQYHPALTDGADYQTFEDMAWEYNNERPAMTPWQIANYEPGTTRFTTVRNPYYWKVDPEGNQLPYIDGQEFTFVEDVNGVNLLGIAGELDMNARATDLAQFPVYQANAEDGGFRTLLWPTASASNASLFFNQSYNDEKYRELFQTFEFRKAMSHAINRETINQVAFLGQGVARTSTVVPDSQCYTPELENVHGEYDPELTEELLDSLGLERGADGIRNFPDGSDLVLIIETNDTSGAAFDTYELITEWFNAVGVQTELRTSTRDVYWPKAGSNEVMVATWSLDRGLVPMVDPIYQFPFDERSWMAPAFGTWYKSGGELGQEPTDAFKAAMALYDEYRSTPDAERQAEICQELVAQSTDQLWSIGTVGMVPNLVVVKNDFRNVGEYHVSDWLIMTPGTQDPSHYYFASDE